jgi:hypothetical protein
VPYGFDPQTGKYYLKLSPTVVVADVYCHWCGGHGPFKWPKGLPFCQCRFLEKCEQDPALPIEVLNNGYGLYCVEQGRVITLAIHFCPVCGGTA